MFTCTYTDLRIPKTYATNLVVRGLISRDLFAKFANEDYVIMEHVPNLMAENICMLASMDVLAGGVWKFATSGDVSRVRELYAESNKANESTDLNKNVEEQPAPSVEEPVVEEKKDEDPMEETEGPAEEAPQEEEEEVREAEAGVTEEEAQPEEAAVAEEVAPEEVIAAEAAEEEDAAETEAEEEAEDDSEEEEVVAPVEEKREDYRPQKKVNLKKKHKK